MMGRGVEPYEYVKTDIRSETRIKLVALSAKLDEIPMALLERLVDAEYRAVFQEPAPPPAEPSPRLSPVVG